MATNFWTSTHYKELLDQEEVDVVHNVDKERGITLDDFKLIKLHMTNYIARLAQNVKVRQRVIATAVTYMRRVYIRRSMSEFDPRLVAPSCLYLASKSEESTVQARLLVLVQDAGMSEATQLTWGLVNDTYKTDLILVHPPYLIGLACIYVASVLKEKENTAWFEDLRVDMNVVKNIAMEILDFYDTHKTISDERVTAAMHKLPIRT
ncbi:Cyclin C [Cynara cardunculus var. scolymus]|uniref:Cyclin C n=1 Tax=Cynara cardunculus var. scolymus TaxID=59895 RepID=A0A103Y775_CYNCS|nr:Cyclin C [Cynara cardunculus var. scolymus]